MGKISFFPDADCCFGGEIGGHRIRYFAGCQPFCCPDEGSLETNAVVTDRVEYRVPVSPASSCCPGIIYSM
jgi:hypothetical protein